MSQSSNSTAIPLTGAVVNSNTIRRCKWFCTVNHPFASNMMTIFLFLDGQVFDGSMSEILAASPPYLRTIHSKRNITQWAQDNDVKAFVLSWELAPTTNHYHLHYAITFNSNKTRRQILSILGPADLRPANGRPDQLKDYVCKSSNSGVVYNDLYFKAPSNTVDQVAATLNWSHVYEACRPFPSYTVALNHFLHGPGAEDTMVQRAFRSRGQHLKDFFLTKSPTKPELPVSFTSWQNDIIDVFSLPPKKRTVINVWSNESGTGKSSMADILRQMTDKRVFVWPVNEDLRSALFMYSDEGIVVFDFPRQHALGDEIYEALEMVSDHRLVSTGKYEGRRIRFVCHVLVLSNRPLEEDRLPGRITYKNAKALADESYPTLALSFDD